jgi:hypothetical protein
MHEATYVYRASWCVQSLGRAIRCKVEPWTVTWTPRPPSREQRGQEAVGHAVLSLHALGFVLRPYLTECIRSTACTGSTSSDFDGLHERNARNLSSPPTGTSRATKMPASCRREMPQPARHQLNFRDSDKSRRARGEFKFHRTSSMLRSIRN